MAPDAALDAAWLASRRWFRHKAESIESLSVEDVAPLGEARSLLVLAARLSNGEQVRYFVPAVGAGDDRREPEDGDGAWRAMVEWLTRDEPRIASERGAFVAHRGTQLEAHLPGGAREAAGLDERRLGAQQSNTSVRLGERLIMKLYRLVEPGINPEVEVCAFLDEAGFRHVPPVAGWIEYYPSDRPPAATAIVQGMVPARGDAWEWMLERLAAPPRGPAQALAAVAQLGGITAELHAALRSRPETEGFEAGPAGPDDLRAWHEAAVRQLDGAQGTLGEEAQRLEELAPALHDVLDAIPRTRAAIRSRIHGDYHLGQLLATERGFVVIDFEGEPARPLAERRRPASPLRDVAGMLRSLDYAARTVERQTTGTDLSGWLEDARAAFLSAYGDAGDAALLRALEVEKACYEVRYEANNRPDWTWLPLQALERLADRTT